MANSYTKASFTIDIPKDVDLDSLKSVMALIENMIGLVSTDLDAEGLEALYRTKFESEKAQPTQITKIASEGLFECENDYLGFDWSVQSSEEGRYIWIRADESIDMESAVRSIQLLARLVTQLQQSAPWYAEWANTCSRMRVDEFGGGAVVFDAHFEEWMDTRNWREETMKNFATIKAAQSVPIDQPAGG